MSHTQEEIIDIILASKKLVFLTGAGVSTLSGIPDYRSLNGYYANKINPEYLLSLGCFHKEPDKFYDFIKHLYHPQAQPNIIHKAMHDLEIRSDVTIITQNIDRLHHLAHSSNIISFHGNLYDIYCTKCQEKIDLEDYLKSDKHSIDNGLIRPDVVLYEEGLKTEDINASIQAIQEADTIVIVGTSFKVYPFAALIDYAPYQTKILLINSEDVDNPRIKYKFIGQAGEVFVKIDEIIKKEIKDKIVIRESHKYDIHQIYPLVEEAFKPMAYADGDEQNLVLRLLASPSYIPQLSLVATFNDTIIGYILFTEIMVGQNKVLSLAPLCVASKYQGLGVGSALIQEGHRIAKELGYKASIVFGEPEYYSQFGYQQADQYGIVSNLEVDSKYIMVYFFDEVYKESIKGNIIYPKQFNLGESHV